MDRFHEPAKEIGFNLAVLLTNLSEHMPNEPRLARFLETAGSVLNYFEPFLGRIEILGSNNKIERVYFEIKESNIEQWEKPQIKESKRAYFYNTVVEAGEKEKLETFINFCEDAIFEMQHASALMAVEESGGIGKARESSYTYMTEDDEERNKDPIRRGIQAFKDGVYFFFSMFSPTNIKNKISEMQQMTIPELFVGFFKLIFYAFYYSGFGFGCVINYFMRLLLTLMRGPNLEEPIVEVKEEEEKPSRHLPALPPTPDESNLQVSRTKHLKCSRKSRVKLHFPINDFVKGTSVWNGHNERRRRPDQNSCSRISSFDASVQYGRDRRKYTGRRNRRRSRPRRHFR